MPRVSSQVDTLVPVAHSKFVIILLAILAVVVAVTVIVLALRRWQRSVLLREEGKHRRGFEVEVEGDAHG